MVSNYIVVDQEIDISHYNCYLTLKLLLGRAPKTRLLHVAENTQNTLFYV